MAEVFSLAGKVTLDGVGEVNKELDKTKTSLEKASQGLKVIGGAFTAAGAAGLKLSSNARELNAQLGQTGLTIGASTEEMRKLALETTNVTFPLDSVAKTFDILARAGVNSTTEMQNAANAFDGLADATGSSAEVMADLLLPAFKLFGESIPQSTAEMDKFTWLTKNTTVDMSDFGTMLTRIAPYADKLNMSLDDSVAILAALSDRGIQGTAATMKLRTAVTQAAESGESLNEILGISQAEIDGYKKQMEAATGITDQYAEVANEQFGIMDKLKQKWSEITLAAGSFLTPLEPIMGLMTALGPVMMFFGTAQGTAMAKTIAHTTAMIAQKVALVASTVAIKAVTAAQWLWNAAMTANPIGLIIAGIAALIAAGVALWKNWDKVTEWIKNAWETVGNFFSNLWDNIVNVFKKAWEWIQEWGILFLGIPGAIIKYWDEIVAFFGDIWDNVVGFFSDAGETVQRIWQGVLDWFKAIPDRIVGFFTGFGEKIGNIFSNVGETVKNALNNMLDMMRNFSWHFSGWSVGSVQVIPSFTFEPFKWLPQFAAGGVIPEPTLLYGLRSMQPYAIAGERGTEYVTPAGYSGQSSVDIAAAIREGLAGMSIVVEVGGEQVAAVVSRQQYRMKQARI